MVLVVCTQQLCLRAHVHLVCPRAALCSGRLCLILLALPNQTGCQQQAWVEGMSRSSAGRHTEPLSLPAGSREGEAGAHLLQLCSATNGKGSDLYSPRKISECTGCEGGLKKLMPAWPWCALNIGNNFPGSGPTCGTHPSLPVGDSVERDEGCRNKTV